MTNSSENAYFGLATDDLEAARLEVERLLGVTLHGRRSGQWEMYYSNFPNRSDFVQLYVNWADAELNETAPDFATYPLIVEIEQPSDIAAQERALAASPLLRAERTVHWVYKRDLP